MSQPRDSTTRAVAQQISNYGRQKGLSRDDSFRVYAMDRLLFRLGRSDQASEFMLKGGVLVASMTADQFRFTRDIDLLRRAGPPDPGDIRRRFERIIAIVVDDGIAFDRVTAQRAERAIDGYDGVKVLVYGAIGPRPVDVQIDIGFGDVTVPAPVRMRLNPFIAGQEPASVLAYDIHTALAEKVETVLSRFPLIGHRLKDVLDVVVVAEVYRLDQTLLRDALTATAQRRGTRLERQTLHEMKEVIAGRAWERDWSTMLREKGVRDRRPLQETLQRFVEIVENCLA